MVRESHALNWASCNISFIRTKLIKKSPWSSIYKLKIKSNSYVFLKIEKNTNGIEYKILPILHKYFPDHLPEQLLNNEKRKYQLIANMNASRNIKPRIKDILKIYGRIQKADYLNQLHFLKTIDDNTTFNKIFRDLLKGSKNKNNPLAKIIGRLRCLTVYNKLSKHKKALKLYFSLSRKCPYVLSHNDLHMNNICINKKGKIIIYDWSDAVFAPLGNCFSLLIGTKNLFNSLILNSPRYLNLKNDIIAYLKTFIGNKINFNCFQHAIMASALLGSLNNILLFLELELVPSNFNKGIKKQINDALNNILEIIDHIATRTFLNENSSFMLEGNSHN